MIAGSQMIFIGSPELAAAGDPGKWVKIGPPSLPMRHVDRGVVELPPDLPSHQGRSFLSLRSKMMGLLHGAVDSFNRLLQSTAADQAAPGPALPLGPQAATAGDRPSGERDPIVRTRPERYGRAIAPDELPGQEAPPPVPVKAHVRSAPGTAAAAPAAEKPPVTLDAIVEQYRRTLRYTTRRHISMGSLVDSWLRKQPERQGSFPAPRP